MDDIGILEAADHVYDGIHLTDICQELVAQAFALGRALHQTCDIHELDDCRGHLGGMVHIRQQSQTGVGHRHHAHVGIDGTEGIVCRLRACLGQRIKQGTLADIRQTHDT